MPTNVPDIRPPLEPLRDSLRALLGVPCFIRRSRSPDALFISDLPRRTAAAEDIVRRLEAGGQWRTSARNGLLELDPAPELWQSLIRSAPRAVPRPQEWYADYPFLAACAMRLIADSPPPERQPVGPLRLTLKRLDAGELDLLERELPPILALLLRQREPLPAAAGLYVLSELQNRKEPDRCSSTGMDTLNSSSNPPTGTGC